MKTNIFRPRLALLGLAVLIAALALVSLNTILTSAAGPRYVSKVGFCNDNSPCHTTINAAVAAAAVGDTIYVFPGTYSETVNLSQMTTEGNITLITVDATGTPKKGTVTVSPSAGPAFFTGAVFGGNVTINGFIVTSPDDDAGKPLLGEGVQNRCNNGFMNPLG